MLTYEKCLFTLGSRETKKLAGNTYLRKEGNDFVVRFHSTDIITIFDNGTAKIDCCGFRTATTKSRINEFTKARVYQKKGLWFVGDAAIPFYDGIVIDVNSGDPVDAIVDDSIVKRKDFLDKEIKKFTNGYIKWVLKNGIQGDGGDCWCCLFGFSGDVDHVWNHVKERYYFGSFVKTAINGSGRTMFWHDIITGEIKRGETGALRMVLTSYFRKIKPQLLKFVEAEAMSEEMGDLICV